MNKIKSEGSQAFNVPATDEGKEFVKLLRKFSNRPDGQISVRGRGKRAVNGQSARRYATSIPLCYSEWFAVYIRSTKADRYNSQRFNAEWTKIQSQMKRVAELEDQVKGLKIALVEGQERYNELAKGSFEHIRLKDQKARLNPPVNPPLGTVTISVKGANIRIVQEQE